MEMEGPLEMTSTDNHEIESNLNSHASVEVLPNRHISTAEELYNQLDNRMSDLERTENELVRDPTNRYLQLKSRFLTLAIERIISQITGKPIDDSVENGESAGEVNTGVNSSSAI